MKTLVFKINPSDPEKEMIKSLQKEYSISFRKLYNNIELLKDRNFLNSLKIKSKKQIEYLQSEVEGFYKRNEANQLRIQSNIKELEEIPDLKLSKFRQLQYLRKSLNSKPVFGNKKELIKLSKGIGDKEIWKNSRLLPLVYYGSATNSGNRFFNLKTIAIGNIIFKPESTGIRFPIIFNPKKHQKELIKLQELILAKVIPVTIKLTSEKLYITFDESKLSGTFLDIKSFYKEIKNVKNKDERKLLIGNKHKEHENKLKLGKLDRYLSIDLNPDGTGYSILSKDLKIITSGFIDVSKTIKANKRKYETSIMLKEIFKLIKHYRCHTIILEDLNFKSNDNLGNKVSNRKVKNLWNRTIISEIIQRRCNEEGILKIEVNPVYTSFIGNIQHNTFDPIASAIEIGRRGINKYSKGGFYPEFSVANFINDERYDKIKECQTWKELSSLFITSKWSYRRELKQFNFEEHYIGNEKSMLKHIKIQ